MRKNRSRALKTSIAIGACATLLLFAVRALPLFAQEIGYWYYDDFGIEEAHEQGVDGTGVKIADVDTPLNLDLPWLSEANVVLLDKAITKYYGDISPLSDNFDIAYHATDMISLLQGNGEGALSGGAPKGVVPGATIYHYAAVTSEDDELTGGDIYDEAVRMALEDDVDLIMIPAGGKSDYEKQYPYLLEAIRRGIPVVVAHANARASIDWETLPDVYLDADGGLLNYDDLPTGDNDDEICYWPGLVTAQALGQDYELQTHSRVSDSGTDIVAPGEDLWMQSFAGWGYFEATGGGCSAATTLTAGYLALAMQKWSGATGNQILQLMVRTTDLQGDDTITDDPADALTLSRDPEKGLGMINPVRMLETDPSVLPDVNPLLYMDVYQSVRNATVRGDDDALTEDALIEVAVVLDEQLDAAGYERPDFLITLLGQPETPEDLEEDTPAQEAVDEAQTAISAPEDENAPDAQTTDPPLGAAAPNPLTAALPLILVVAVIVVALVLIFVLRKKKA